MSAHRAGLLYRPAGAVSAWAGPDFRTRQAVNLRARRRHEVAAEGNVFDHPHAVVLAKDPEELATIAPLLSIFRHEIQPVVAAGVGQVALTRNICRLDFQI